MLFKPPGSFFFANGRLFLLGFRTFRTSFCKSDLFCFFRKTAVFLFWDVRCFFLEKVEGFYLCLDVVVWVGFRRLGGCCQR